MNIWKVLIKEKKEGKLHWEMMTEKKKKEEGKEAGKRSSSSSSLC